MRNLFLLALVFAAAPAAAQGDPQTDLYGDCGMIRRVSIYGDDNREEYCAKDLVIRSLADAVVGLFKDNAGVTERDGRFYFRQRALSQTQRVSAGQRFADQPAPGFCTGFLVGEDLVVTAGHCVKDHLPSEPKAPKDHAARGCQENPDHPAEPYRNQGEFCEDIRFVFGFRKDLGGVIPRSVDASQVFRCKQVVKHSLASGADYTVVRLDRKVNRVPLAIDRGNSGLAENRGLFVAGHPSGLPLKIAGGAQVTAAGRDVTVNDRMGMPVKWVDGGHSFMANLDTFGGNSGSPVFNARTLLVEGILVKGDSDYEPDPDSPGGRRVSTFTALGGAANLGEGVGEVCTKISQVADKVPATDREAQLLEMNRKAKGDLYRKLLEGLIKRAEAAPRPMFIPNYVPPQNSGPKEPQWI